MGGLHGGTRFSASDHSVSGGVALLRVTPDGGNVVIEFGGEPFADDADFGHTV